LRVFDRYGERNRRMKARFKFLLGDLGLEKVMALVEEERIAIKNKSYVIDENILPQPVIPEFNAVVEPVIANEEKFERWRKTNVFEQKQKGFYGVYVKLPLGNMSSNLARTFADIVDRHAADELRITVNQGYLLRFVRPEALKSLYVALDQYALAEPGFDSVADITACPGTESCALAISDSTQISLALEKVIREEYPDLIFNTDIKIKISGCPNSCGQHGLAGIGFHGSTIKDKAGKLLPALVVLLGGGKLGNGGAIISDKVGVKIPSKRGPDALRFLLNDYEANAQDGEYYHDYYQRQGQKYFYAILKPLGDLTTVTPTDYIDWGEDHNFILHTAVGECAGVIIDLVATLLYESEEKIGWANEAIQQKQYADSIYHSYNTFINTAKAMLLTREIKPSTQIQVLNDFQKEFAATGIFGADNFREFVLRINKQEPSEEFAIAFLEDAKRFLTEVSAYRAQETKETEKEVVAK
jgi:sulfite reductase (ferredoxin)